ncbi:hypothetical protein G6F50_018207 [Rhizopus delemar]|uniref:Uncharacterized protein n=1 Tax=Rhizopus delemar TaxID=936053 RepID=A0A9P6XNW9_9FUNG|nr:hypothetical protein G6F50_018207 [Rhizopus delemar]
MPMSSAAATSCRATPTDSAVHSGSAASSSRALPSATSAPALKCLATAASSYSASGWYQTTAFSAISFRVCTRSRSAITTSSGAGPAATSRPSFCSW